MSVILKYISSTLLVLSLFAVVLTKKSHASQFSFIEYNVREGLPQSQVQCLMQDQKGYLWIGTLGGVCRFDGKRFVSYSTSNGLADNQVNTILEASNGILWVGSLGGLSKISGRSVSAFPLPENFGKSNILAICEIEENNFLLATDGKGILEFNTKTETFLQFNPGVNIDPFVRSITIDKAGNLWIATKNGVHSTAKNIDHTLDGLNANKIFEASDGSIWISTFGQGAWRFNQNTVENFTEKDGLVSNWIRDITEGDNGVFWFASKQGICKYENKMFNPITKVNGLPSDNTSALLSDREGILWIGTNGSGLIKFPGETFSGLTERDGLSSNVIMSVVEDNRGDKWFGTYSGGISRYDGKQFYTYGISEGLPNSTVWSSLKDKGGSLWFGTSDGIAVFDGGKFRSYRKSAGFLSKKITALFEDDNGNIWVGQTEGLSKISNPLSSELLKVENFGSDQGFTGKNVRDIFQDAKGNLWFATTSGVYSYDGITFMNYDVTNGFNHSTVYSIQECTEGHLWFATKDGITFYDGIDFQSFRLGIDYSTNLSVFMLADENMLWVGTMNGVFSLDLTTWYQQKEVVTSYYSYNEGMGSSECNLNAAFKDNDGLLWFGTIGGATCYNPKAVRQTVIAPGIEIEEVNLFLQETDWSSYDYQSETDYLPANPELKYNRNHLTFNFTGISHSNPDKVSYQFMLEGFDEEWTPVSKLQHATYSNIPPGDYNFVVKARDSKGIWSVSQASFPFSIGSPFWMTGWFYSLSSILSMLGIFGSYKLRTNSIRRKHKMEMLESQNKMYGFENQALSSSMNKHFIFNALNSIQHYINKQNKILANVYLSSFARLIRLNLDNVQTNIVSLSEELERLKLYLSLEHMRFEDKFKYKINVDGSLNADKIKVPAMILQPFIENSIKHGILPSGENNGIINVSVSRDSDDSIVMAVEDNGIGITKSLESKKNGLIHHSPQGISINRQRLSLLRKMTNKEIVLNGPEEIRDKNGKVIGTRVEIILPLHYDYNMN